MDNDRIENIRLAREAAYLDPEDDDEPEDDDDRAEYSHFDLDFWDYRFEED